MKTGKTGRCALTRAGWGLAALSIVGMALPIGSALAAPVVTGACADAEEMQFLELINQYRADNGLGALALSQSLSNASEYHSQDMATKGYFEHTMPDGTTVEQNIRNHGYRGTTFGENIVAGTETAEEAFDAWKKSPAHNENMLRSSFKAIGIGRYEVDGSPYGWYWTTDFGGTVDRVGVVCGQAPAPGATGDVAVPADASGSDGGRERSGGRKKAVTNDPDVNVRSGPGRDFPVIDIVAEGTAFELNGAPLNGYLPVSYGGQEAWVAEEWVDVADPAASAADPGAGLTIEAAQAAAPDDQARAIETINLRSEPDHESGVLTMVMADDPVTLTGTSANGYVEASYQGVTGWLDSRYVSIPGPDAAAAPADAAVAEGATFDESLIGAAAIATEPLNLRSGPSRAADVAAVVPAGTALTLNGNRDAGYLGITYDGLDLWADAAYLQ